MSNDKLKFWVKCPECQKPFGVHPKAILQYLNRLIAAHGFEPAEPVKQPAPKRSGARKAEARPKAT